MTYRFRREDVVAFSFIRGDRSKGRPSEQLDPERGETYSKQALEGFAEECLARGGSLEPDSSDVFAATLSHMFDGAYFTLWHTNPKPGDPEFDLAICTVSRSRALSALTVTRDRSTKQIAIVLFEPTAARYAKIVADTDDDDPAGHINRARFRLGVFDFAGALEDVDAALKIEASRSIYLMRANLHRQLGDLDKALDDYFEAENLQPDGSTFQSQVELLALLDRAEEGLDLADEFEAIAETESARVDLNSTALGWAGSADEGLEILEALAARRPGDGSLLNQLCWFAGIWDRMSQERLAYCSQAVEKSDFSAAALDSRALAHYRMGDLEAARADIEAALISSPGLAAARLMKGIIRVAQGEAEGRGDIDLALSMRPAMRKNLWSLGTFRLVLVWPQSVLEEPAPAPRYRTQTTFCFYVTKYTCV